MITSDEVLSLFPSNAKLRVVPSLGNPKLIFQDHGLKSRWNASSLLPATRLLALLAKGSSRLLIGSGLQGEVCKSDQGKAGLEEFLDGLGYSYQAEVLLGTPGPAQKASIRIRNESTGAIAGFIKYGSGEIALERLENENKILTFLPKEIGPRVIKYGPLGDGLGLMVEPLDGVQPMPEIPLKEALTNYLRKLQREELQEIDENVDCARLDKFSAFANCMDSLTGRPWPKVISHGDFAPWNLRISKAKIRAFDWEFGSLDGIPFYDVAFYVQQVGALIYKWSPERVRDECLKALRLFEPELSDRQALAFTSISAMKSYVDSEADGHPPDFFIQPWRKKIWEVMN